MEMWTPAGRFLYFVDCTFCSLYIFTDFYQVVTLTLHRKCCITFYLLKLFIIVFIVRYSAIVKLKINWGFCSDLTKTELTINVDVNFFLQNGVTYVCYYFNHWGALTLFDMLQAVN